MNKNIFLLCFVFLMLLSSFRGGYSMQTFTTLHLDTIKEDTVGMDTIAINKILTADDKFNQKKKDNRAIYRWGDNKKMLGARENGGVALSINKLFSHFSRIGKQARRLQRVFERDYEQDKVETLWKPLTVKLTGLKGDSLFYFQMYFLPKSIFLENASYYEKVAYVTQSMRAYRDSTDFIHQKMKLPAVDNIIEREEMSKR